jgi:hypothetical protein
MWIAQRLPMGSWTYVFQAAGPATPNASASAGGAAAVSIVSTPHAGRLEGARDRPEFMAIRLKTKPFATHCKAATYRSVTWKH